MRRKRYRYILNGSATGGMKICDFRLIGGNNIKPNYNEASALRVEIPDDLKLCKFSCDSYSTTSDERTLNELGYDILIWNKEKEKWFIRNDLKGFEPHEFHEHLRKEKL